LKSYASEADAPAKAYLCACGSWHLKPRRPRGDGALYKNAEGLWVARVELPRAADGSRRWRKVSSKDRNVAIRKLKKLRADVDAGRIVATGSTTVEKWLDHWIENIHRRKIRPGTYASYERIIRLHIKPHIGQRRLDQLTAAHVRQMHDAIESSRNAQIAHDVLTRALTDAEREGMIGRNVATLVDKPGHVAAEREPLTADQAKQLLRSAIAVRDPLATRWAAALLLGARQAELLGLQWSRVDLTTGVVDFAWQLQSITPEHGCGDRHGDGTWPCGFKRAVSCPGRKWELPRGLAHQQLDGTLFLTPPKTKKGTRIVPIPAPLWAMLEQLNRGGDNPHDLVWHNPDGSPIDRYSDYDAWQAALATAGLPAAPLHVARHTTASLLLTAGVPEDVRMAILGHAGAQVQRAYAHVDQTVARKAMAALDQLLS
jgi:integrase